VLQRHQVPRRLPERVMEDPPSQTVPTGAERPLAGAPRCLVHPNTPSKGANCDVIKLVRCPPARKSLDVNLPKHGRQRSTPSGRIRLLGHHLDEGLRCPVI
jgi:hypothetical protein